MCDRFVTSAKIFSCRIGTWSVRTSVCCHVFDREHGDTYICHVLLMIRQSCESTICVYEVLLWYVCGLYTYARVRRTSALDVHHSHSGSHPEKFRTIARRCPARSTQSCSLACISKAGGCCTRQGCKHLCMHTSGSPLARTSSHGRQPHSLRLAMAATKAETSSSRPLGLRQPRGTAGMSSSAAVALCAVCFQNTLHQRS